jgi:hypothetical protein
MMWAQLTQAKTSAFSAMLKYACLDGRIAGSFAKLLAGSLNLI